MKYLIVDYFNVQHTEAMLKLLQAYACDPMGGAQALDTHTTQTLIPALQKRTDALSLIAYKDENPVGLLNAFEGFSTFKAKPLWNIHDVYVMPKYRHQGIASTLFEKLEGFATQRGACKLTLEVLSNNNSAKKVYRKLGFEDYSLEPSAGTALFWQKNL